MRRRQGAAAASGAEEEVTSPMSQNQSTPSSTTSIGTNAERPALELLLAGMVRSGASTVVLLPGQPPLVRVQGALLPTEGKPLDATGVDELLRGLLFEDQWQRVRQGHEVHFLYTTSTGERLRTVVMRQDGGLKAVMRRVPAQIPTFESLGLPELLSSFIEFQSGLVMLTLPAWRRLHPGPSSRGRDTRRLRSGRGCAWPWQSSTLPCSAPPCSMRTRTPHAAPRTGSPRCST